MLAQLPWPVGHLLHASWALHNVEDPDFDSVHALARLRSTDLIDYSPVDVHVLFEEDHPLDVLYAFVDLHEEVQQAVQLYAQCINAVTQILVNPWAQVTPVILSPSEYARIASAFWTLKIFYQLDRKFFHYRENHELRQVFVSKLRPWQLEQVWSVEQFLQDCMTGRLSPFYRVIDKESPPKELLLEHSLYFRNYCRLQYQLSSELFPFGQDRFRQTVQASRAAQQLISASWNRASWEVDLEPVPSSAYDQLRNHGWLCYDSVLKSSWIPSFKLLLFFSDFGLFFWDYERLAQLNLAEPSECIIALEDFQQRVAEASRLARRHNRPLYPNEQHLEKEKARLIIQWTRCRVPCAFEEFSRQETVLSHCEAGLARYA
ncbi:hypothetical protein BU26DRAFT_499878 [Trematosphaeria pertusa]|uniref:Uncharacterized protein n=1 Tax=Trematosphaeria pertusa TaxID=390896 RepID=A0A6A6J3U1_9PLEO|nr:uncharacterized protein BU26DRAFT_499878 [Trematosphaeria pertusa]KAF2257369.1 hypothetical protein BU26DRAFT_499878 [Trematosphaeria pertusa]